MGKQVKERAADRRERQARELTEAYNNGGDFESIIKAIKECGDSFKGMLYVDADGVYSDGNGDGCWLKVMGKLPNKPTGWGVKLYYVNVFHR